MTHKALTRLLGITAILVGIIAIMADMISIFTTSSDLSRIGMSLSLQNIGILLVEKSHLELVVGHYLALFSIPIAGCSVVLHTYLGLRLVGRGISRLFLFSGLIVIALGAAYHGLFGISAEVVKNGDPVLIEQVNRFFEPLGVVLTGFFLVLILCWTLLILTGRTYYPRWVLLFSPLPVLALTTTLAYIFPIPSIPIRVFLMVTNMNLPITTWAIFSTIILWDKNLVAPVIN